MEWFYFSVVSFFSENWKLIQPYSLVSMREVKRQRRKFGCGVGWGWPLGVMENLRLNVNKQLANFSFLLIITFLNDRVVVEVEELILDGWKKYDT